MQNTLSDQDLNLARVAKILRISRPLALRLVKTGQIPCHRGRSGIRVHTADLRDWVEGRLNSCDLANPASDR